MSRPRFDNVGSNKSDDEVQKAVKRKQPADIKKEAHTKEAPAKKRKTEELYETTSSAEAHAKQRALAKSRKLAKPNANEIERAKKLWERLRRKSHVPKIERQKLVAELFELITGKVKDFVFKHDSVRTIQTALKYATQEQRKQIARELRGEYKPLIEGKYSKFLVAKILVQGDAETRGMIVQEFNGHVKKLINHPEASWILDDTYRQVATADQKAKLLREWYGAEYSVLRTSDAGKKNAASVDLVEILKQSPEKRQPILKHLHDMINQMIQKNMTAFTMLHDAMLQYSLAISIAADGKIDTKSEIVRDWVQELVPDEEADFDLLKNLAFTASGCRVVNRALAMATAKDRKNMLKVYKDHVETLACDSNAITVLLTAYEVVDDTRLVPKLIFPELLAQKIESNNDQQAAIAAIVTHPTGRLALLWPLLSEDGKVPKWLVGPGPMDAVMKEVNDIKAVAETSKKPNLTRKQELVRAMLSTSNGGLITTIQQRATELVTSPFGCQYMTEVLLRAGEGDTENSSSLQEALEAVASLAAGDPSNDHAVAGSAAAGRMLKSLAQGGPYDAATKQTSHRPWLDDFPDMLWRHIQPHLIQWATGPESFTILALAENKRFGNRPKLAQALRKSKSILEEAGNKGNKGSEMLLKQI